MRGVVYVMPWRVYVAVCICCVYGVRGVYGVFIVDDVYGVHDVRTVCIAYVAYNNEYTQRSYHITRTHCIHDRQYIPHTYNGAYTA